MTWEKVYECDLNQQNKKRKLYHIENTDNDENNNNIMSTKLYYYDNFCSVYKCWWRSQELIFTIYIHT